MKNLKIKKMIVVLLVAIVTMTISTQVLATGLVDPTEGTDDGPIDIVVTPEYPEGEGEEQTPTTPTTPTDPTTPSQGQETLPQTGDASDYAIFLLIAICVVVSIYAYKKVRDYNRL